MAVNWHCWLLYENEFDRPPLRARFISKVPPPEEHGDVEVLSAIGQFVFTRERRRADNRTEQGANSRKKILCRCSDGLWLRRTLQVVATIYNSTSADDTVYFLSPLSSLVLLAPFAVAHKHTLSLPCCHHLLLGGLT